MLSRALAKPQPVTTQQDQHLPTMRLNRRPSVARALFRLAMRASGQDEKLYYMLHLIAQYRLLHKHLQEPYPMLKTLENSKEAYEAYDDREQQDHENRTALSWHKGKLYEMPLIESRSHYLNYLYEIIDARLTLGQPTRVLEVGCGNCINLVQLNERYGNQLILEGLDVSPQRIRIAKKHFGERLSGISIYIHSIVDRVKELKDEEFDIVFSMHCLEQVVYQCAPAVEQMHRLAKDLVIMIEPIYELGNPAQRLYLINQDHNRTLLHTIKELGLTPSRIEPLDIQSNPLNQSSIVVIEKQAN